MILSYEKTSQQAYQQFTRRSDDILLRLQKQIPKLLSLPKWFYNELNTPCFICLLPSFPKFSIPVGVINLVSSQYPILKKFCKKLEIKSGNKSQTKFIKEKDCFAVTLNKNLNYRHQVLELVHELGHVVAIIESFKNSQNPLKEGKYKMEMMALAKELKIIKTLSPLIFRAHLANFLLVFHRVLFELACYRNPKQNMPELYAQIFNHCFPGADQKTNYLFLLDERITVKPLSSLSLAVAGTQIFHNLFLSGKGER